MTKTELSVAAVIISLVWLTSVIITIYDKAASRNQDRFKKIHIRVPEKTLLLFGALGGAIPMYITMKVIRHKTMKSKFMVGLPAMAFMHAALITIYFLYKNNII